MVGEMGGAFGGARRVRWCAVATFGRRQHRRRRESAVVICHIGAYATFRRVRCILESSCRGSKRQGGKMADVTNVEKGTEYEQFVQDVYQAIVSAEGVENIKVEHNIQLEGNSGCEHQIDVYWEFRLAGQTYKTAIECKAYNQSVSIGKIRDFYGVLVDVPGLTGIFATLVGYQSGAKKYAEHYGISLKELREPTDADWQGRVQDINLNLHVVKVQVKSFQPRVAPAFLATLKADERSPAS
jgi:predicted helicase